MGSLSSLKARSQEDLHSHLRQKACPRDLASGCPPAIGNQLSFLSLLRHSVALHVSCRPDTTVNYDENAHEYRGALWMSFV